MEFQALLDLAKEHQELLYGLLLFLISELIGMSPKLQANSVIQLIIQVLRSKVKKTPPVVILLGFIFLSGCAGTALNGRICTIATDQDAQRDVKDIVESYTDPEDQKKASMYLRIAKLSATSACEVARARQVTN